MTLGDDPQPLTRRQLRERARAQSPETPDSDGMPDSADTDSARSADSAPPKEAKPSPKITTFTELIEQVENPDTPKPRSIFAPRADGRVPVRGDGNPSPALTRERATAPERTLTRRELREMMATTDDDGTAVEDGALPADSLDLWPGERPGENNADALAPHDPHAPASDEGHSFDQLMSRGVGAGGVPTTSNALILPSIPQHGSVSGAMTSTGEILITGSIDLPRSLGSTGQHPNHFDSTEMDHLLDPLDEAGPTSSVAPVSASRAVSTHTSTRGVMTPPKNHSVSLPTVLAITAGALLVGVVALFAAGYLFQIF
jgi:hypothetical protein